MDMTLGPQSLITALCQMPEDFKRITGTRIILWMCVYVCVCGENGKLFSPKPKYILQVVISHYKFIQTDYCCAFSVYGLASQKAIKFFRSSVKACRHMYYIGPWPLDLQCHWQTHFFNTIDILRVYYFPIIFQIEKKLFKYVICSINFFH